MHPSADSVTITIYRLRLSHNYQDFVYPVSPTIDYPTRLEGNSKSATRSNASRALARPANITRCRPMSVFGMPFAGQSTNGIDVGQREYTLSIQFVLQCPVWCSEVNILSGCCFPSSSNQVLHFNFLEAPNSVPLTYPNTHDLPHTLTRQHVHQRSKRRRHSPSQRRQDSRPSWRPHRT